jgi:hypothetical protein
MNWIQSLYVEKAKNMEKAVLGTMLQRPLSFPKRQFSLIFLFFSNLKTEEESQIYCCEIRCLFFHKIPERLTAVYQNITRIHWKSRQNTKTGKGRSLFCLAEINMHHGWPLRTPGKVSWYPLGWSRCVSHSRSACGKYFLFLSQIEFRSSRQCLSVYCVIQWDSRSSHLDRC